MIYSLECPNCHATDERNVPVAERNKQGCKVCRTRMVNVTAPTKQILIPGRFHTTKEENGQPA